MGKGLNIGLIEYKLLQPREYRLFGVAEMMNSDLIPQETKDNVLEIKQWKDCYAKFAKRYDG